jgi:hypothetical protein
VTGNAEYRQLCRQSGEVTYGSESSEMIFAFIAMAAFAVVFLVLVVGREPAEHVKGSTHLDRSLKVTAERKL